jgi:hypothetical protein
MTAFATRFPDLAARETRSVMLPFAQGGVPAGTYGFLECYCQDPNCDCRRVLLEARPAADPDTVLATVNYGWESEDFYAQRLGGDTEAAREITAASLDPLNPQSPFASWFLSVFQQVVLQDKAYIERLKRHYAMFKQALPRKPQDERRKGR